MTFKIRNRATAFTAAWGAAAALWGTPALANDFPTLDRVMYVRECMQANPGQVYEMIAKCSCALDRLAEEISFENYSSMSTLAKAVSIGGERGGALRENESIKPAIKLYKDLQAKVYKACMITPQ